MIVEQAIAVSIETRIPQFENVFFGDGRGISLSWTTCGLCNERESKDIYTGTHLITAHDPEKHTLADQPLLRVPGYSLEGISTTTS